LSAAPTPAGQYERPTRVALRVSSTFWSGKHSTPDPRSPSMIPHGRRSCSPDGSANALARSSPTAVSAMATTPATSRCPSQRPRSTSVSTARPKTRHPNQSRDPTFEAPKHGRSCAHSSKCSPRTASASSPLLSTPIPGMSHESSPRCPMSCSSRGRRVERSNMSNGKHSSDK
jgi:hypothetical protein